MLRPFSYIKYQQAFIHYSEYGKGEEVILCFHGFGQSNEHFTQLELALGSRFKVFSFDLFYHGKSFWHEQEKPLSKEFWCELIQEFLKEKNINRLSVLGFSMGGKFALTTVEYFYNKIDNVILIAPDGIKNNLWYRLATSPAWMRKVFRSMVLKPKIYLWMVRLISLVPLVDKRVLRFANSQMKTREQRRRVYYSWITFRCLKFDMKKIAAILNENHIKLEMFLGEYDRIITRKHMGLLLDQVQKYSLHVLPSGHSNLIEAVAKHYREVDRPQYSRER